MDHMLCILLLFIFENTVAMGLCMYMPSVSHYVLSKILEIYSHCMPTICTCTVMFFEI